MSDFFSRRDLDFNLFELHGLDALLTQPRYAQHDRDSCAAMLDAAFTLATEQFLPHAAKSDASEPNFDGARVQIIPEVQQALRAYIDAGFLGAGFDAEVGGLQLPTLLSSALATIFSAANAGTAGYMFLTGAAASLIRAHGSAAQQQRYMRPMLEGRYFGTMCLSEPQAGSSLADIKTRATPRADGRFNISGNKMWISGGEHDLSDNIVHLLLARIDGAPAGTKGISLFIVPKKTVHDDGSLGAGNGVRLIGLNHKMGYRGTVNTALAFGDGADCIGELVGAPQQGLACMFHMMNEARIGVGMGAVALGYAGYRYALEYSKTRAQGRLPSNKDPASRQVPIIEHVDVRRMLLAQKSYVEGGLALGLYCARLVDAQHELDENARVEADTLLGILTPIVKSWPSEYCLEANKLAIQCLGGYGYTRDYPVERLYRDNRLNHIHEGTYGIQGLDLLGRKVLGDGGKALRLLSQKILATAQSAKAQDGLQDHARELQAALAQVGETTAALGAVAAEGKVDLALANATLYLDMLGHAVMAWLWLQQALVATKALAQARGESDFYQGKLAACRYFYRYELPKVAMQASVLMQTDPLLLAVKPAQL